MPHSSPSAAPASIGPRTAKWHAMSGNVSDIHTPDTIGNLPTQVIFRRCAHHFREKPASSRSAEHRPRLETGPETPILPKGSFSQRRLSMSCWSSETFIVCNDAERDCKSSHFISKKRGQGLSGQTSRAEIQCLAPVVWKCNSTTRIGTRSQLELKIDGPRAAAYDALQPRSQNREAVTVGGVYGPE